MLYGIRILTCLIMIFICQKVVGGVATGTLAVTANVGGVSNCTLGSVTNMLFPNYSSLNSKPTDATGTITVNCVNNIPYDIGIDKGQGASATEEQRLLTRVAGKQELNYNLYQDPGHVYLYGTMLGQNTLHQIGSNAAQIITIYGEIPKNQSVEAGPYRDIVNILVIF